MAVIGDLYQREKEHLDEIARLQRGNQALIDQKVGQAMDCAKHEESARAEERAKVSAKLDAVREAVGRVRKEMPNVIGMHELDSALAALYRAAETDE